MRMYNTRATKITNEQVGELLKEYMDGATQRALGIKYGLSTVQVGRIVRGESHRSITMIESAPIAKAHTEEEVEAMAAETEKELIKAFESKPKVSDRAIAYGARFVETANVEMPQRFIDEVAKLGQTEGMLDELKTKEEKK